MFIQLMKVLKEEVVRILTETGFPVTFMMILALIVILYVSFNMEESDEKEEEDSVL